MCFTISYPKYKIADKDIKVYKYTRIFDADDKTFTSYVEYDHIYYKDKLTKRIKIKSVYSSYLDLYKIEKGYHSITKEHALFYTRHMIPHKIIFGEFIIPKGTRYIINNNTNEIVSEQLIYKGFSGTNFDYDWIDKESIAITNDLCKELNNILPNFKYKKMNLSSEIIDDKMIVAKSRRLKTIIKANFQYTQADRKTQKNLIKKLINEIIEEYNIDKSKIFYIYKLTITPKIYDPIDFSAYRGFLIRYGKK